MKRKSGGSDLADVGHLVAQPLRTKVVIEGRAMSAREAMLLGLYNRSLGGDIEASIELQRIRESCSADEGPAGCLVMPEAPSLEEWIRLAAEQQAQFRERGSAADDG